MIAKENLISVCCACEREKVNGFYIVKYRSYEGLRVTHGYCPDCFMIALDKVKRMKK